MCKLLLCYFALSTIKTLTYQENCDLFSDTHRRLWLLKASVAITQYKALQFATQLSVKETLTFIMYGFKHKT